MKNRLVAILALGLVLSMAGCKLEHNSKVKYAQLKGEVTTIETVAKVELPNCHNYKDKTQPSKELVQTNDMMAKLFPGSEFEGCKNEGIESMATYTVPMEVGAIPPDGKEPNPKGIAIMRNANGEVFFFLSKEIRERINQARKNVMASKLALNVNIKISNNTDANLVFQPHAIFADGTAHAGLPRWGATVTVPPSNNVNLTLSNVSTEFAIAQGVAPIFWEVKEQPKEEKK